LFMAKDNNPTSVELAYSYLWEQDILQNYKGLFHANPNGFTYAWGWAPIIKHYTQIQTANTKLRDFAKLKSQVATLESTVGKLKTASVLDLDSTVKQATVGGLGSGMVLVGVGLVAWRRKQQSEG